MKTKIALLVIFIGLVITSCKRDDPSRCESCENGGYCVDTTCVCPTGFEGDQCEIKSTMKFLGNYNVYDTGSFSWTSCIVDPKYQTVTIWRYHPCSIYEGNKPGEIIISNYFGDGSAVTGTVSGRHLTLTDGLKISYGTSPQYSTDICFLNEANFPKTIIDPGDSSMTIDIDGYCYKDLGTCGNEIMQTTCRSIFIKKP
jgi:hypothetical protein